MTLEEWPFSLYATVSAPGQVRGLDRVRCSWHRHVAVRSPLLKGLWFVGQWS